MKPAFGMFVLTKREQRVVIVIMFALVTIALVKHYHDTGTIIPAQSTPPPQMTTRITAPAVRLSLPANWLDGLSAVEPSVLHAPLVVGAVDPDGDPLHIGI